MKEYTTPDFLVEEFELEDVLTLSIPGTGSVDDGWV